MTKDPVCRMQVDETKTSSGWAVPAVERVAYDGRTYYFCSPACKKAFDEDPRKYVGQSRPDTGTAGS